MPNKRKRRTHSGYKARLLAYKIEGRQLKNKKLKIARHILKHPNDLQAQNPPTSVSYVRRKTHTYWERHNLDENTRRKSNGYGSNNGRSRMSR